LNIDLGKCDQERYLNIKSEVREVMEYEIGFFLNVLRYMDTHPDALIGAADLLSELGYYEKSLQYDLMLVNLFPDNSEVRYNYACSLSLCNQVDQSYAELINAIQFGYNNFKHLFKDRDLESVLYVYSRQLKQYIKKLLKEASHDTC